MDASFINPGPNYLSAGETVLPNLYLGISLAFLFALIVWIKHLREHAEKVHKIHHMMTVLLVLKLASVFFESVRFHYIKSQGFAPGWSAIYYVFTFLKSMMMFVVILLIGTGWSLLKPYLTDREKKIVAVVLVLQVLDNIALVVMEETAPGSQGWLTWHDILHLVDIICCCAILFPIVWSIRHLRQAAAADGKGSVNHAV
jgi:hypothetical protein